jgi:hypothetical protein
MKLGENIHEEDQELDRNDMIGKMSRRREEGRTWKETDEELLARYIHWNPHLTFNFNDPKSISSVLKFPPLDVLSLMPKSNATQRNHKRVVQSRRRGLVAKEPT